MGKVIFLIVALSLLTPMVWGVEQVFVEQQGMPLTVTATASVFVDGTSRLLYPGQKVLGLAKVPGYKIILEGSQESWLPVSKVAEPVSEFSWLGYQAYMAGSYEAAVDYYKRTIAIDPSFANGYLWLAESYLKLEDFDNSYLSIIKATKINDQDATYKLFAQVLADEYFDIARNEFDTKRYQEAIEAYQKVLELNPNTYLAWIELGKSYEKLDLNNEAYSAWGGALNASPEAPEVYALLRNTKRLAGIADNSRSKVATKPKTKESKPILSPELANEALNIVKMEKTKKGTPVETAIKSLLALTKSLGEQASGKGWDVKMNEKNILVSYIVERENDVPEVFEWLVDSETKQVSAHNENARLLMNRW